MKLERRPLAEALTELKRIVDSKSSMEILKCCLIQSRPGEVELHVTDLYQHLRVVLPRRGSPREQIKGAINCHLLAKIVGPKTGKGDVLISESEGQMEITVDDVVTKIPFLPAESFPGWPSVESDGDSVVLEAPEVESALSFVLPAVSTDESRPYLCGVLLEDSSMIGIDGHRLHSYELSQGLGDTVLIPRAGALTLLRITRLVHRPIQVAVGEDIQFRVGDYTLISETGEVSNFPPYKQTIPRRHDFAINVDGGRLGAALKRVGAILAGQDRLSGVELVVNGSGPLLLKAYHPEYGESETGVEILSTDRSSKGDPFRAGFSLPFLLEVIPKGMRGAIRLEFGGPFDPVKIHPALGALAVVMPMRV